MENTVLTALVAQARASVEQTESFSEAVSRGGYVPSLVKRMLQRGEWTGEMESALASVSRYYDEETPKGIRRMFAIIEPVILILLAGVVLFISSAVLLPVHIHVSYVPGP